MSVLDLKNIHKFLRSGAVLALQGLRVQDEKGQMIENPWILAWEEGVTNKDSSSKVKFYLAEFTEEVGKWVLFKNHLIADRNEILQSLLLFQNEMQNPSFVQDPLDSETSINLKDGYKRKWKEPEFEEFKGYFVRFQEQVRTTDLKKVVPVVFSTSDGIFNIAERCRSLIHFIQNPDQLFFYGYWNPREGILGASPELLFKKIHEVISTMALAGTGPIASPSLLEDTKERFEHQLVIEDIQKKLSECDLKWGSTQEWKIGVLKHLKTEAHGVTKKDCLDLLKKLHPTAALGVVPSHHGLNKVAEFCNAQLRKYFGAPFGIQFQDSRNNFELFIVALRNIQWDSKQTYLGSGCGLVNESQLEKEWKELQLKREFTKRFLNL